MDLHLRHHGDPSHPRLVLVHGLTDDGANWPDAVARWRDRWHVVTVDQRGHGASPRFIPEQLARAPEVLQEDLVAVVRAVGPAILVGHSLGGLIAARVAHDHPELVRGAVLEDPAKPAVGYPEFVRHPDPEFAEQNVEFVETVTRDPEGELARMRRETTWGEAELRAWAASKAKVDRRYLREGMYLGDTDWEEMFDRMRVPTLVVVPVDGPMTPDAGRITNPLVTIHAVEEAGHCVRRDRPDAFHALVDPFLDALRD